jgi:hypothetical protein
MCETHCWHYSTIRYQAECADNLLNHGLQKQRDEKGGDIKKLAAGNKLPSGKHNKPSC